MEFGLEGRHILITGASGGIGLVTARMFLEENAKVTGTYRSSDESLRELEAEYSDSLNIIRVDQTSEDEVQNLFDKAHQAFGRIDVLVANAAISNPEGQSIQDMTLDRWDETLRVNLTGSFLCAKYFFSNLEKHSGESASLILVGSTAGLFGEAWYVDYSTSKAAMHGMMLSLKNEIVHLAPKGRVNLVNPGWTLTPMAEKALSDRDMVKRIHQTIPMRKTALPEDIAGAILYLASDKLAGHVSGQTITVAGGMEGRVLFSPDEVDST